MEQYDGPSAELTYRIIGLAMRAHREVGPGLLESIYEKCLCCELDHASIPYQRQVLLALRYHDIILECGSTADIIVDHQVVLELKAVEQLLPVHEAQLMTYLRLTRCRVGLLINFTLSR